MGRKVAWGSIPDTTILPRGIYPVKVDTITEGETRGGENAKLPAGCYQLHVMLRVVKHPAVAEFDNMPVFDRFTIGTEGDPRADDPATWAASIGAKRFKQLLRAAKVETRDNEDLEAVIARTTGRELDLRLAVRQMPDGGETNEVKNYYHRGDKDIAVERRAPAPGTAAVRLPAPANRNSAGSRLATAAATAEGIDEDRCGSEGSGGPVSPLTTSTATPTSASASATATAATTTKKRKVVKAEALVACEECDQQIPAGRYSHHMAEAHVGQDDD